MSASSSRRRRLFDGWIEVTSYVGDFQSRLILTVFYFTVFAPFGAAVRLFSDPLGVRRRSNPGWLARPPIGTTVAESRRQY